MITVHYTCAKCGLNERPVQVPARTTEDVRHWVGRIVASCIGDDHRRISPQCRATTMSQLRIPMPPEAQFIGQQVE